MSLIQTDPDIIDYLLRRKLRYPPACVKISSVAVNGPLKPHVSVSPQRQSSDGGEQQRVGRPPGHRGVSGLCGDLQWESVPTGAPVTAFPSRWQRQRGQPDQRGVPQCAQTEPEQEATGNQIRYIEAFRSDHSALTL